MNAFEFVIILLSFVYALALTHVLSRTGALVLAYERVRFSSLSALMIANAVAQVFLGWLILWDLRSLARWDLVAIIGQFALGVLTYFMCLFAAMDVEPTGEIDLEARFWRQRRPFYASVLILYVLSLPVNAAFLETPHPSLFLQEDAVSIVSLVPIALALFLSMRWAQWVGGTGMLAFAVYFTVRFYGVLN